MAWTVIFLDETVEAEMEAQPGDIRARFDKMREIVVEHGPVRLPPKWVKHIDGELWELRMKGRDGIARAFYAAVTGKRLVILRVFTKKSQKTPPREIKLAKKRAEEIA